jgi:hypothetical protein
MIHDNEYHVALQSGEVVMVGFTRVWTDDTKQKWVDDIPLTAVPYSDYKSVSDKKAYVEQLAETALTEKSEYLGQLAEVINAGLYDRGNPGDVPNGVQEVESNE